MISTDDILCMEYLKKTEFTGCDKGMRYRLEKITVDDNKKLLASVWPEPFNFFTTPKELVESNEFSFDDDGVKAAVDWMNEVYTSRKKEFSKSKENWDTYKLPD